MARVRPMTPTRRLASTAAMFAIALVFLVIASTTHDVWPLFVGWIPLLAVPWFLTRAEAETSTDAEPDPGTEAAEAAEPVESAEPTEPAEAVEPVEPVGPVAPQSPSAGSSSDGEAEG
jgi:hypothetical protein